jgi:hypothetical protein
MTFIENVHSNPTSVTFEFPQFGSIVYIAVIRVSHTHCVQVAAEDESGVSIDQSVQSPFEFECSAEHVVAQTQPYWFRCAFGMQEKQVVRCISKGKRDQGTRPQVGVSSFEFGFLGEES